MIQSFLVLSGVIENVTIGQILVCATVVLSAATLLSKLKTLLDSFKKTINGWVEDNLKPEFDSINQRLAALEARNERQDLENVKNYLVLFMANIESSGKPDEVEILRFEEQYAYYTKKGGNSYIHKKYEKLKSEGKL